MSVQLKLIASSVLIALCPTAVAWSQGESAESASSSLQEHYTAAQQFQKENDLDKAAVQYRAFLVDALSELALGHAHAADYAPASPLFDEALALDQNSTRLRLDYARTSLLAGNLSQAETLARSLMNEFTSDPQKLAQVHQILGRALLKMNRDQEARTELETAVAIDPSFENGYDLAVACLDLDDEKCAVHLFGEMQASFGDSASIHMSFGRAFGNSDFAQDAVAEFRKAIAEDPRFPGAHYSLAAALLDTGDNEPTMQEVESELKKELAISPNDFLTYAALGKLASARSNFSEAESYLKRATALNPNNPDAFLYLGQMYFDTGRPADAQAALRQAIALTTDLTRNRYQVQKAHFLLGRILMQEHRETEAHAEMQFARELANKGLSHDKGKLAGLLQGSAEAASADDATGQSTESAATARKDDSATETGLRTFEMKLTPAIADSYNNLGAISATNGDYEVALRYFESAAKWNPQLDGLDYNLGRAAFSASRFTDAITPLSRYLSAHPDVSGARAALAMSQFMVQDYNGCIATLQPAQEDIMSVPQIQYVFAESLVKTGQVSSGKERLQSLAAVHPEISEVHRGLGEVLALQGDRPNAVKELQTAIGLNATDPEAHGDLGNIEIEAGDANAAIREVETAIRLLPNEPKFHLELAAAYRLALRPADAEKELRIHDGLAASKALSAKAAGSHAAKVP